MFARTGLAALALLTLGAAPVPDQTDADAAARAEWVKTCKDWDEWDKPAPPFRIHGNTYYVGTCGISSILITAEKAHILIDGGPANAGALIAANIEKLGFKITDVKFLLHSHEHHDHVGGLAELQRRSGAYLIASKDAAPVLANGEASPLDPQFELHNTFPPAHVAGTVDDREEVRIIGGSGPDVILTPIYTPGHTSGALSWQWKSCEGDRCKKIVYADSLTPVSGDKYRFSDHPETVAAFRDSLGKLAALDCDILLSPHPSAAGMRDKLAEGDLGGPPLCKDYAEGLRKKLDERLAKEAADSKE